MKKKLIIDILMFILMILEFSRLFTGALLHELIGITLFILVIIHLILNKNYILNIRKAKYNVKSIIMLITNILLVISFLLTIVFGLLSSQETLTFLNVHNLTIVKLHKIFTININIFFNLYLVFIIFNI